MGIGIIISGFKLLGLLLIFMAISILAMGIPLGEIKIPLAIFLTSIFIIFGVWCRIVAWQLAKLNKFGLNVALVTLTLLILCSAFSGIYGFFANEIGVAIFNICLVFIFSGFMFYLTRPKVKEQFKIIPPERS